MKTQMTPNSITHALQHMLSQPPSCVGRRLRSERILATHLALRHSQVRKSLDELVAQGYLVRRHGSGTFVRKVVQPLPLTAEAASIANRIKVNELFTSQQPDELSPLTPDPLAQSLQIAFWSDMFDASSPRYIATGIAERIAELGHQLCEIPIIRKKDVPISINELHQAMQEKNYDGHIVITRWADMVRTAFGNEQTPAVFLWPGNFNHRFEPLIEIDICNSIDRAVEVFTQTGYERIGIVYLDDMGREPELERRAYEQAMHWHGHQYRQHILATYDQKKIGKAIKKMMGKPDRPQAIYISSHHQTASIVQALEEIDCLPGRDIAVISIANAGFDLPQGYDWSQMRFNSRHVGRIAVDSVLRVIQSAGEELCSYAHRCTWQAGTTHLMAK